jgi:hypothetical protein
MAKNAEDLGYATLLAPDHVPGGLAPIAALAAAEAATALRIGCYVFGNDFRHLVILAKEAATATTRSPRVAGPGPCPFNSPHDVMVRPVHREVQGGDLTMDPERVLTRWPWLLQHPISVGKRRSR